MKRSPSVLKQNARTLPHWTARLAGCAIVAASAGALLQGCGLLGDKKEGDTTLLFQNNLGCLDGLGPLVNQYIDGTVSESKWDETWACVDDTLETFTKFVKGNDPRGYNHGDIKALIGKFLITGKFITNDFVHRLLDLKAGAFGGEATVLTMDEVKKFREIAGFLRTETRILIPHLRNRTQNPTPENLRAMATAVSVFGEKFSTRIGGAGNRTITSDMIVSFMNELDALSFQMPSGKAERWVRFLSEVKTALIRGETNGIGGADWNALIRLGTRFGAEALVYVSDESKNPNLQIEVATNLRVIFADVLAKWGGTLPHSQINALIDRLPAEMLPERGDELRAGAKQALPKILVKVLKAGNTNGLDSAALDTALDVYRSGMRSEYHLELILAGVKDDVTPAEFQSRANFYVQGKPEPTFSEVTRLKALANRYLGLHPAGSPEILFRGKQERHSRNNLAKMSWYELIADKLLRGYGSKADGTAKKGNIGDLEVLVKDIEPILIPLAMVHPQVKEVWKKRFREANIFTPSSNGDLYLDTSEVANYLAFLISAGKLSSRMADKLFRTEENPGGLCPQVGFDNVLKLKTFDLQCFRREFFANASDFFRMMPSWQAEYDAMSSSQKAHFAKVLETASKRLGYDELPVTTYDLSSFSGLPHFVEGAMRKFDKNETGALSRSEVLENVWPMFKNELQGMTGIKIDAVNRTLLLYIIQKGASPFRCDSKPTAKEIADLLWWLLKGGPWSTFTQGRMRIYEVFAALSKPATKACPDKDGWYPGKDPLPASIMASSTNDDETKTVQDWSPYKDMLGYFPSEL